MDNGTWSSSFEDYDIDNFFYESLYNSTYMDYNTAESTEHPGHFMDMSLFWNLHVLYPIIMCVGIIGNGITIVILTRRHMRSITNQYLTALAISDLLFLIFAFTITLHEHHGTNSYLYLWCYPYASMLFDVCSCTSIWLIVTVTIERYVAVCHPIRGKVLCTQSMTRKVVGVVVCVCFLVFIITPFEYVVEEMRDVDNHTMFWLEHSALGHDHTYRQVRHWFTLAMFSFLPFFLLTVFSCFLICSVLRRTTMRDNHHDKTSQKNRITIMLIVVTIMQLICNLPLMVIRMCGWYASIYSVAIYNLHLVVGLSYIFHNLMAVGAACKFTFYFAFSDKFRQIFLKTFIPCVFTTASSIHSHSNANTVNSLVELDSLGAASEAVSCPSTAPLDTEAPVSTSASTTPVAAD